MLDPTSLALKHCGYLHLYVCNDSVHNLLWETLLVSVRKLFMNNLGIVYIDPVF